MWASFDCDIVWDWQQAHTFVKAVGIQKGPISLGFKPAGPLGLLQQIDPSHDIVNDAEAAASGACMHSPFWLKAKF